jgi:tetratricopeptide (TPR) repeat protein
VTDDFLPVSEEYPEPAPASDPSDSTADAQEDAVLIYDAPEAPAAEMPAAAPVVQPKRVGGLWVGRRTRLESLSHAVEMHPEEPANYVLRGEVYYQLREYALAETDFRRGLELAAEQVEANRWGFVAQALQDRALNGLEKTRRRLAGQVRDVRM